MRRTIVAILASIIMLMVGAFPSWAHDPHTVKRGDTLAEIAADHGTSWQAIYRANRGKISNPNLIYPGQRFSIPGGSSSGGGSAAKTVSPLRAPLKITQHYGVRGAYTYDYHTGVDFADTGSDVVQSVRAGRTVAAGWAGGWGYRVVVKHGKRYSWYAHLRAVNTWPGERVAAGERIGLMGSTGFSTGKHLHYGESVGGYRYSQQVRPVLLPIKGY